MAKRVRTCGQNWSEIDTELLISFVKKNRVMWHPDLLKRKKNNGSLWEEIGDKLSRPSKECTQKWTALKTYYRQELKKEQVKNYMCNWRHKNLMSFYLPSIFGTHVSVFFCNSC
jgi:hypothetical protein